MLLGLLTSRHAQSPPPGPPPGPVVIRTPPETYSTEGAGWNFTDPPLGNAWPLHKRALEWFFEDEDVILHLGVADGPLTPQRPETVEGHGLTGWTLRDYTGTVVAEGTTIETPLNLGRPGVGWYKLYFHRATDAGLPYGMCGGETTFIVSRTGGGLRDTPVAVADEGSGWVSSANRSYIGSGLVRIDVDINDADRPSWRASLDSAKAMALTALANLAVLSDEPGVGNDRQVFVQFPDGESTGGVAPTTEQQYQITTTVQEMCAIGVTHFEGRNEPITSGRSGAVTAAEYAAFAPLVHAAHPDAKVGGPCPVNINPTSTGIDWFRAFLVAGGGDHLDFITFHPYNATNNDINQGRRVYGRFIDLLAEFGQHLKPRWMTEYGHYAWVYGSFEPRWQAQVMMAEGLLLWQHGVHRNHVMHYYDFSVGYWSQPMFMWNNNRDRKTPSALPLMWRTWVEETWGMDHAAALDFGAVENRHWIGSRFVRADGVQCLTIMGSGREGSVRLAVTGAASVTVADHFGRITTTPVVAGEAAIQVGPEPVHVRLPAGVDAQVIPAAYGTNVTPYDTIQTSASTGGTGTHRVVDGLLNNKYEGAGDTCWIATPGDYLPAWWTGAFGRLVTFDAVEVICPPPWQQHGSLLDFDILVLEDSGWRAVHTETVPTPSLEWVSDKAVGATWSDSFWSRKRIFVAHLAEPVTASAIRLLARRVSHGGAATIDQARTMRSLDADGLGRVIGQAGSAVMTVQEIAIYQS